ncbi:chemotaxis protein CheC [Andreprevotia chitinilytica]|uniref:chemotaxis protein CheC n=1 Tax=Andreprevotia chitinilytica TaxID=396808 RepID=UPI000552E6CB|nr:chemotaxis protein CheC [Andreprevotia chitinilytica]
MLELTDLQQDALTELFNISVGQAASVMSKMVNEEVTLSVPAVRFMNGTEAADIFDNIGNQRVSSVCQRFSGTFSGEALLIFPEDSSLEIVRLMIGKTIPLAQLTELEQDALTEVGNIILNACLCSLSDFFAQHFDTGMPCLRIGSGADVIGEEHRNEPVLFLHVRFTLAERSVEGYVAFLMNLPSLHDLRAGIDHFLAELNGGASGHETGLE